MPRTKQLIVALALMLALTALSADVIFVVNSTSRTLSRIDTDSGSVNNSFAQLGLTPNLMDLDEEHIYVVCTGDNAVQVLDRFSGAHQRYLPVAPSSNPYDVLKVGDFLYVTGLFTNRVYKLSLQTNSVVGSLEVGAAPQGLCSDGTRLYVCNTGGYHNNYANSSVSVIDLASFAVTATVPTWTNPQFAVLRDRYLHVSCTGNWSNVSGKLDIIDLDTLELVQRLDVGGNPGSLWISPGGTGYIGEGYGNALYSYNADTHSLEHGAANPLNYEASMVSGNAAMIALLKQNWDTFSLVRAYSHDFTLLGQYQVGLSSSDILVVPEETAANDELLPSARHRVYPNPLKQGETLHLDKGSEAGEFRLYNLKGKMVHEQQLAKGETSVRLDGLSAGVYFWVLKGADVDNRGKLLMCN